ncbi:MAG: cation:proton antiporter [Candidatus Heimdallarchaeota archaeon]|nr:cation:proton antiporter [Candidatus Heimdallarchaeota archaeon]MCK4253472.1 cation:proton antiporter [Candidatus Heimdallarchaeota archaeon]
MVESLEITHILLFIGIGLFSARLFGEFFERMKLSAIVGELVAGILIGGPLFLLIGVDVSFFMDAGTLQQFSQIGILLLLFIVGLEINIKDIRKIGKQCLTISITEVLVALAGGFLTGYFLIKQDYKFALFFGLLFTATSIGVTVRTLSALGKLDTRVGRAALSVAVLDDFLALILVLVLGGTLFPNPEVNPWLEILYLAIFIVVVVLIIPQILKFLEKRFNIFSRSSTQHFSIGIIFALLVSLSFFASFLGFSGAIIAFLLGLSLQRNTIIIKEIKETFVKIGEGVFIPLFFFMVGATFQLDWKIFTLVNLLLIPIAIGSKALGTFIGGSITGFKPRESAQLAVGMMPRAEIVIIIAEIGLLNGIFTQDIFSMAILLVLVTVLITPLLLKLVFREKKVLEPDIPVDEIMEITESNSQ